MQIYKKKKKNPPHDYPKSETFKKDPILYPTQKRFSNIQKKKPSPHFFSKKFSMNDPKRVRRFKTIKKKSWNKGQTTPENRRLKQPEEVEPKSGAKSLKKKIGCL